MLNLMDILDVWCVENPPLLVSISIPYLFPSCLSNSGSSKASFKDEPSLSPSSRSFRNSATVNELQPYELEGCCSTLVLAPPPQQHLWKPGFRQHER